MDFSIFSRHCYISHFFIFHWYWWRRIKLFNVHQSHIFWLNKKSIKERWKNKKTNHTHRICMNSHNDQCSWYTFVWCVYVFSTLSNYYVLCAFHCVPIKEYDDVCWCLCCGLYYTHIRTYTDTDTDTYFN